MTNRLHLSDDQLIEISLGPTQNSAERGHLNLCSVCQGRRDNLFRLLEETVETIDAQADVVFSPERLLRQRSRILQRLEQEGRPGRVVTFPAGEARTPRPLRAHPGMRWVAAAAAAGLVVGVLADHFAPGFRPAASRSSVSDPRISTATLQTVSATMSEDEFLGQLEMALERTGGSTLQPLHDMTPLVWEVTAP